MLTKKAYTHSTTTLLVTYGIGTNVVCKQGGLVVHSVG